MQFSPASASSTCGHLSLLVTFSLCKISLFCWCSSVLPAPPVPVATSVCWSHSVSVKYLYSVGAVQSCQRLQYLSLDHIKELREDSTTAVCRTGLRQLQRLELSGTPITASTLKTFYSPLALRLFFLLLLLLLSFSCCCCCCCLFPVVVAVVVFFLLLLLLLSYPVVVAVDVRLP